MLRCTLPDGSITWQKQPRRHAVHFTHHHLTNFAIETALGYQRGFFGSLRADLFRRWAALPEGGRLSLDFGGAGSDRNAA
ncbi:MAG: hypothetical protein FJW40_18875 [Acidobacteria bacterium]|nr:hypothetical protein [Acidobacteriota bacterium]